MTYNVFGGMLNLAPSIYLSRAWCFFLHIYCPQVCCYGSILILAAKTTAIEA